MAIVKASYTRKRDKIKATVRYTQHRPGKDGEKLARTLFGLDGTLTRQEAYELIDAAAKGTVFYHLKISPDPRREDAGKDLSLRELTEQTLLALSEELQQDVAYVGTIHDDHAAHRHMHVIAMVPRRMSRQHLQLLRDRATEAALLQRRERDLALGIVREKPRAIGFPGLGRPVPVRRGGSAARKKRWCRICGLENCLIHDDGLELDY